MKIEWAALGIVSAVSIGASVVFVLLLASGIRILFAARLRANAGNSATAAWSFGYALLGLAGALVLFGLYLIIPQFH